jgi:hypothetical protein
VTGLRSNGSLRAAAMTDQVEIRLYARQGGKRRAMRAFIDSLPEADRGNVRVFTRQDAEAAQRRREELLAELRELDGQWFA